MATAQQLLDLHKSYVAANVTNITNRCTAAVLSDLYYVSYFLHGSLSAAEGTGDTEVLEQVIDWAQLLIAGATYAETINGITYDVWGPNSGTVPNILNTLQGASPIARLCAVLNSNSTWRTTYAADLADCLEFVDQTVIRRDFDKTVGRYKATNPATWPWEAGQIPYIPTALGGWGTYPIWHDKPAWIGAIAAWMYQGSSDSARRAVYLDIATRVGTHFQNELSNNGSGFIWEDGTWTMEPAKNTYFHPDTSHCNREPMMMVAMYENGIVFDLADITRMSRTLTDIIYNGNDALPAFSNYIDGSNQPYNGLAPWRNGVIYAGWPLLGRYDAEARAAIEAAQLAVANGYHSGITLLSSTNFTAYGKIALTGHCLRNLLPSLIEDEPEAPPVEEPDPPPPNVPPVAVMSSAILHQTVNVNGAASTDVDGTIVSYSWSFGDGNTATGTTATHAYAAPGTYTITLTATDDDAATGQDSEQVVATAPPVALVVATPVIHLSAPPTATFRATTATPYVVMRYTLDGTEPTSSSSIVPTGLTRPFPSGQVVIIKVKAFRVGYTASETTTEIVAYGVATMPDQNAKKKVMRVR